MHQRVETKAKARRICPRSSGEAPEGWLASRASCDPAQENLDRYLDSSCTIECGGCSTTITLSKPSGVPTWSSPRLSSPITPNLVLEEVNGRN